MFPCVYNIYVYTIQIFKGKETMNLEKPRGPLWRALARGHGRGGGKKGKGGSDISQFESKH